jgi:polysaccharide export outer membrane protein
MPNRAEREAMWGREMQHARIALVLFLFAVLGISQEQRPSSSPGKDAYVDDGGKGETLDALPQEVGSQPQFQMRNSRYVLRPSDALEIGFTFTPEFNQTITVQPDGFVTLKEIGDVKVQGKTLPELRASLRQAYSSVLHDPVINVVLKDFEKPFFTAGGELRNPGKFDLRGDTTVTEALATAGGFRDSAKHSEVFLFRKSRDGWVKVQKINVKKMLASGDLREDAVLHPGDMLFVPKNRISKFRQWLPSSSMSVNPAAF